MKTVEVLENLKQAVIDYDATSQFAAVAMLYLDGELPRALWRPDLLDEACQKVARLAIPWASDARYAAEVRGRYSPDTERTTHALLAVAREGFLVTMLSLWHTRNYMLRLGLPVPNSYRVARAAVVDFLRSYRRM